MGFRLTLSNRIKFFGMVGGEKKFDLLQNSKGLLFPVRWHEPFGLAITESLYFGCPIFGTPYGSLPEIVNQEVGILSNDAKTLAKALENASYFSSKRCHEYAFDTFNSYLMAKKYCEKYEQVVNGHDLNPISPRLKEIQKEKFLPWYD